MPFKVIGWYVPPVIAILLIIVGVAEFILNPHDKFVPDVPKTDRLTIIIYCCVVDPLIVKPHPELRIVAFLEILLVYDPAGVIHVFELEKDVADVVTALMHPDDDAVNPD